MNGLLNWLDNRTGYRRLLREVLYESIPGGARWRYVWGSTLTFALLIQVITGIFLWMAYSPSAQTAWESVYYIEHQVAGGWLLRGLHHFTAQVMIVLLVLHLLQVVIDGAYRAPREVNFWFGLVLLQLVLALSLTGYLLPWDQKGYWATKVATNIAATTPVIGPALQKLIIGGTDYGHHTLTRFFALHAGVLPGMVVLLVVGHIYLFRRHGIKAKLPLRRPAGTFWPDQVLQDTVACLAVLLAALVLVFVTGGAPLFAPANPAESFSSARPEWYFLFLFEFLKHLEWFEHLPGEKEVWGAIFVPSLVLGFLFLMPFIGRWKLGHRFNVGMILALLAAVIWLTFLAMRQDRQNPEFALAIRQARAEAERVVELANSPTGISASGAAAMLRTDPKTQGPKLFAKHCATCHRYDGHDGLGQEPAEAPSAADLHEFASREWIAGLLDPEQIGTPHYFGGSRLAKGEMARFVRKDVARYSAEEKEALNRVILALSAAAQLPHQRSADLQDAELIAEGRQILWEEKLRCTECHVFRQPDEAYDPDLEDYVPDLTDYGSREWLIGIISNPAQGRFYDDENDRMPAFAEEGILDAEAIGMLADWLRGDWYAPKGSTEGGRP